MLSIQVPDRQYQLKRRAWERQHVGLCEGNENIVERERNQPFPAKETHECMCVYKCIQYIYACISLYIYVYTSIYPFMAAYVDLLALSPEAESTAVRSTRLQ